MTRGGEAQRPSGLIYNPGYSQTDSNDDAEGPKRGVKTGPTSSPVQSTGYPMTFTKRRLCIGRGRGRRISTDTAHSVSLCSFNVISQNLLYGVEKSLNVYDSLKN